MLAEFRAGRYGDAVAKALRWERELRAGSEGGRNKGKSAQGPEAADAPRRFERLVQAGRLRKAVRLATGHDAGTTVLQLDEVVHEPSGRTAYEELLAKHPRPAPVARSTLCELEGLLATDSLPEGDPWNVTEEEVQEAVRDLDGSAGVSGNDAATWRSMLTKHGVYSQRLRSAIARLATTLGSENVAWRR